MVKLTVLYNLPEGADHEAFIAWRTGPHQAENAASPGVIRTDFFIARDTVLGPARYKYVTEAFFPDLATLEAAIFNPESLAKLRVDVNRLADTVFLVSEERAATGSLP